MIKNNKITNFVIPSLSSKFNLADLEKINKFASSFNGYEFWGSSKKCFDESRKVNDGDAINIRTRIFAAYRSQHHVGSISDEDDEKYYIYQKNLIEKLKPLI